MYSWCSLVKLVGPDIVVAEFVLSTLCQSACVTSARGQLRQHYDLKSWHLKTIMFHCCIPGVLPANVNTKTASWHGSKIARWRFMYTSLLYITMYGLQTCVMHSSVLKKNSEEKTCSHSNAHWILLKSNPTCSLYKLLSTGIFVPCKPYLIIDCCSHSLIGFVSLLLECLSWQINVHRI